MVLPPALLLPSLKHHTPHPHYKDLTAGHLGMDTPPLKPLKVRPARHPRAGEDPGQISFILTSILSALVKALAKHSHNDHIDQTNVVLSNSINMRLSPWPGFLPNAGMTWRGTRMTVERVRRANRSFSDYVRRKLDDHIHLKTLSKKSCRQTMDSWIHHIHSLSHYIPYRKHQPP